MHLSRHLGGFYRRFIGLQGEPRTIAAGMALGVFVGVTPTIPFHTTIILVLALLLRQNITAACLGSWIISNPLTVPILYITEYQLGRQVLVMDDKPLFLKDFSMHTVIAAGSDLLLPLLAGGFLLAPLFAVAAYLLTHRAVQSIRRKAAQ